VVPPDVIAELRGRRTVLAHARDVQIAYNEVIQTVVVRLDQRQRSVVVESRSLVA
jgi:hypothetical protein